VDVYWRSDRRAALFDFLAAIAMLVSTTTALEIWRRRELRWWQFSLRSFFVLTAVATVVAILYVNGLRINWWRSELYPQGQTIYQCGLLVTSFEPAPGYVVATMLLGIACTVFTFGWAVWNGAFGIARLIARIRRDRRTATVS